MLIRLALIIGMALCHMPLALALDICPLYAKVSKMIEQRIQSGVPFKLLSVAAAESQAPLRKVVRIEYDLWDEMVTIEIISESKKRVKFKEAADAVCQALSFPVASAAVKYSYKLFLNPGLNTRFKQLRADEKSSESRLIKVDWDSILKDFETENLLLQHEFTK